MATSRIHKNVQNIKVVVRVRPMNSNEIELNYKSVVHVKSPEEVWINDKKYIFDRVFKDDDTQLDVYQNVVNPIIKDVFFGYNCTIFTYGQTGTGKTFTMSGGDLDPSENWKEKSTAGCIPRAANKIFHQIQTKWKKSEYIVRVSYIELYNEEVRDLLSDNDVMPPLNLFNDPRRKGSVYIEGVKEVIVSNENDVYQLLVEGTKKQQTGSNLVNHNSSRSHTVFTFIITSKEESESGEVVFNTGKLNMVDLAGSENLAKTGLKDLRAVEASNINKSLLTLGRVIHSLAEKAQHVPYRESKLTRILQDSLGGTTKTCFIATISPCSNVQDESISTLEYALRAKNITNCLQVNEKLYTKDITIQLNEKIARLQKDLDAALCSAGFKIDEDNYKQLLNDIENYKGETSNKNKRILELNNQIKEMEHAKMFIEKDRNDLQKSFEKTRCNLEKYKQKAQEKKLKLVEKNYLAENLGEQNSKLSDFVKSLSKTNSQLIKNRNILQDKLDRLFELGKTYHEVTTETVKLTCQYLDEYSEQSHELEVLQESVIKVIERIENEMIKEINSIKKNCTEELFKIEHIDYKVCDILEPYLTDYCAFVSSFIRYNDKLDGIREKLESGKCMEEVQSVKNMYYSELKALEERTKSEIQTERNQLLAQSRRKLQQSEELQKLFEDKDETCEGLDLSGWDKNVEHNLAMSLVRADIEEQNELLQCSDFFCKDIDDILKISQSIFEETVELCTTAIRNAQDVVSLPNELNDNLYRLLQITKTFQADILENLRNIDETIISHTRNLNYKLLEHRTTILNKADLIKKYLGEISKNLQPINKLVAEHNETFENVKTKIEQRWVNECLNNLQSIEHDGNTPARQQLSPPIIREAVRETLVQKFDEKLANGEIEVPDRGLTNDSLECSLLEADD